MDSQSEATIPFLSRNEQDYTDKKVASEDDVFTSKRHERRYRWGPLLCFTCLIIITNIVTISITNWNWKRNLDGICSLYTSQSWTPVFDEVDLKYTTTTFNGTFFKETIYRQDPSPEVDDAWRALGTEYTAILVPPENAERANIALDRLKLDEEYGGPGYPAIFEVMHQLHCLNLLRKSNYLYYDYYSKLGQGPFGNPDQLKPHIGHCLENIRQQLMCTADTGLHPFLWAGNPPHVFPDFNREHKCKNFEAIRDFAERHQGGFDELDITPGVGELVLNEVP